ncbi:MAG: hypothetical protein ACJA13_000883 [Paraglaciecola sp.]|jgi:hypothetical protein
MTFKFLKMVLTTCRYAMCISVTVLSVSGTASATLIDSIAALNDGDEYRVMFATSEQINYTSTDIIGYDAFVTNAAATGSITSSLGLSWKALIATTDANDVMSNTGIFDTDNSPVTFFNTLGQVIAISSGDLMVGGLYGAYNGDEYGNGVDCADDDTCDVRWLGTRHIVVDDRYYLPDLRYGYIYPLNFHFVGRNDRRCPPPPPGSDPVEHYCPALVYAGQMFAVSSIATVTKVDVPGPRTIILYSLGLAGLSFARYRRQS